MATSKFRVGGGYTTINFNSNPLLYVDLIRETAPRPVAAPQSIQPMDSSYPIEIAFPHALEAGTLEITFREQWDAEVWAYLPNSGFKNAADLLDIFKAQLNPAAATDGSNTPATLGSDWTMTKTIKNPSGTSRVITYQGIVVVNVMVDETVNIGTMTFPKSVQMMYLRRFETQNVSSTNQALTYPLSASGNASVITIS